jgi:hypothetical protein
MQMIEVMIDIVEKYYEDLCIPLYQVIYII